MLKYTTPPLLLGNLSDITRVTGEKKKTHDSADLTVFTTPLALPAGLAHWAAALGSSIYPPFRLLAASAWLPSQAARELHHHIVLASSFLESSPSFTSKSLGLAPSS